VPRETWHSLEDAGKQTGWWIEIPAHSLRQLGSSRALTA
jgi:hypothetical protein